MLSTLAKEVKVMPETSDDNRFVHWFLAAYTGEEAHDGALKRAVIGGKGDGGIDAVLINDDARRIFLVQGKYGMNFSKSALHEFSDVADNLRERAEKGRDSEATHQANHWWKPLNANAKAVLNKAIDRLKHDYELHLLFVTTASISVGRVLLIVEN